MTVSPSGVAHVAWLDRRDCEKSGQDIYYATVVDGEVGANEKIATTVCECCAPGLTVDAAGNPLVAYREGGTNPSREIFARWSTNGGRSFGEAMQINKQKTLENGCPMSAPAVAVSDNGNKYAAAWKDIRTGEPNVYWTISDKPESAEGQLVHDETTGKQDHPSLSIDASGTVWVAWEDARAGHDEVWIRSSRTDDTSRRLSDPGDAAASLPTIATGNDLVAVVYASQHKNRKTIQFHLIASGE
jgi:hypothetical protein